MNSIVDTINAAGRAFAGFALPMLIQSSVLIVILLVVDDILRKRGRAVFRYWIWMLVLVKLVLPPSLGSPVSIGAWLGDELEVPEVSLFDPAEPQAAQTPATELPPVASAIPVPPDSMTAETAAPQENVTAAPAAPVEVERPSAAETDVTARPLAPTLSGQGLVLLVWSVVVLALTLLLVQRACLVRGLVGQAQEADRAVLDELEDCRRRLGLHRGVGLRLSPNASSPAVCGLVRPVILIPQTLAPRLHSHELRAVLLHELAHVKRGDLWINLVQTVLQIAYFYNPLLWLANVKIRRTREQAVDETVLVVMGQTARQYPETLLNIAKLAFERRPTLALRLIGVVESRNALAARIKHMLTRPIPTTAKLGLLGLVLVLIAAAVLLPMARAAEESFSVTNNGPLDVRLMGVCPDGEDVLYDADGKKLDATLPPLGSHDGPWGSDQYRRDFVFQAPGFDKQLLLWPYLHVYAAGTAIPLSGGSTLLCSADNPATLVVAGTFNRTYRKTWAGFLTRNVPVRKVDLTLRYFSGARREAMCTFTGPFVLDKVVQAEEGRPYQLTPTAGDSWSESQIKFRFTTNQPFDTDAPVLLYDTEGRRHLVLNKGGSSGSLGAQLTYDVQAVPWDEIAAITIGEQPHEATFHNVVVQYPNRPARTYAAHWDRMAERLGLTGLSPERLAQYQFKNAQDAIAVLDIIRAPLQMREAVQALGRSRPPVDFAALDAVTREKIRRAALSWVQSPNLSVRCYGVELGLTGGYGEFVDPAFALLDYRHPAYPSQTFEVQYGAAAGLGRYTDNMTPADIERLKQFVLRCEDGHAWNLLFEHCLRTSRRPAISDLLWELAQDDRPWLWWPALAALIERHDERPKAYAALPEAMKLRVILVSHNEQPDEAGLLPKIRALLPGVFTLEMLRMNPSNWWDMHAAVTSYLDRKEATALYLDLLSATLESSLRLRFERDYGPRHRLHDIASSFLQDINAWYGLNIGQLGLYQPGTVNQGLDTPRAYTQAVTEALDWYRAAGQPQPLEPVFEGRVVDTSGRGIEGAAVTLTQWWDSVDESGQQRQQRIPAGVVQTDADGHFVFRNLVNTRFHNLEVEAQGFAKREDMQVDRLPDGRFWVSRSTENNVIIMDKPASLSGRVIGVDGLPLVGAAVRLQSYPTHGEPSPHPIQTDTEGRFAVSPLMAGYYLVQYGERGQSTAAGDYEGVTAFQLVRVDEGQTVENVTLDLRQSTATLEVEIVDGSGQPVGVEMAFLQIPIPSGNPRYAQVLSLTKVKPQRVHRFPNLPPMEGQLSIFVMGHQPKQVAVKLLANQTTRCRVNLDDLEKKPEAKG